MIDVSIAEAIICVAGPCRRCRLSLIISSSGCALIVSLYLQIDVFLGSSFLYVSRIELYIFVSLLCFLLSLTGGISMMMIGVSGIFRCTAVELLHHRQDQ